MKQQHEKAISPLQLQRKIAKYIPLVERVAKVEYRRIPNHMVDLEELISIGAIAVQNILKGKTPVEIDNLNISYVATATRWAIRNELRSRYKWYTMRQTRVVEEAAEGAVDGAPTEGSTDGKPDSPATVREAVYESILSIDGMMEGTDGDSSYDCISDGSATPEEYLEIVELGKAIKAAISQLPPKERTIVEYRFYRNMQVKEIAAVVGLSSSRVTRIVQSSLDMVREYLKQIEQYD